MNKTKSNFTIALINVVKSGDYQYEQEVPLGLASIASFIRSKCYDVILHQCFVSKGTAEIDQASEVIADLYGFQLNMVNYLSVKQVIAKIKEKNSKAITVLGGPFLIYDFETILKKEQFFDFIIYGEGEHTFLELIQTIEKNENEFNKIDGLVWRNKSGQVVHNEPRKNMDDLDKLPFPARDFLEDARKDPLDNSIIESIRFISSRGCIGTCNFCCVNKHWKGKRWRGRSPKNVVDELEMLVKDYKVKLFNFSDSSFEDPGRLGKQRAKEICEEIIKRNIPLSIKVYMRCETMKSHEDLELLKLYKRAGIDVIIPGAESGSDYELRYYEKLATIEDNFRTIKILRDLDLFFILVGFIMFGPNSTKKNLLQNLKFLNEFELDDNLMQLANVLILIRGSKLYYRLKDEGRLIESDKYWEPPKYKFIDPLGERMAKHWVNLYFRYQATKEINTLQMNLGNLIYRMTNPMNKEILKTLNDDYIELKEKYFELRKVFGNMNSNYFKESLFMIEKGCSDRDLLESANIFFNKEYSDYIPAYAKLYNNFLDKVKKTGFSLSGLVFQHFFSTIAIDGTERI